MNGDILFWVVAAVSAMLVGVSKGGLPLVGMIATPLLALVLPASMAAGLLLPIYIITDLFGLYVYRHHYNGRVLAIMLPAAGCGVGLGWATALRIPQNLVSLLVGLIGVGFALFYWFRAGSLTENNKAAPVGPGLFWGVLTGFTSFVSHAGAPPWQSYALPLGMRKEVYAGTTTILFAGINAIKLIPYWALGQLGTGNLEVSALLAVPGVAAVFAGVALVRILPQKLFYSLTIWALFLVSLGLVWQAVRATSA